MCFPLVDSWAIRYEKFREIYDTHGEHEDKKEQPHGAESSYGTGSRICTLQIPSGPQLKGNLSVVITHHKIHLCPRMFLSVSEWMLSHISRANKCSTTGCKLFPLPTIHYTFCSLGSQLIFTTWYPVCPSVCAFYLRHKMSHLMDLRQWPLSIRQPDIPSNLSVVGRKCSFRPIRYTLGLLECPPIVLFHACPIVSLMMSEWRFSVKWLWCNACGRFDSLFPLRKFFYYLVEETYSLSKPIPFDTRTHE